MAKQRTTTQRLAQNARDVLRMAKKVRKGNPQQLAALIDQVDATNDALRRSALDPVVAPQPSPLRTAQALSRWAAQHT